MAAPVIAALVDDLLDRSRVEAAFPGVVFTRSVEGVGPADVVVVDLATHAPDVAVLRAERPDLRIVAFGRHTEMAALAAARTAGADQVLPRSQFFRDPAAAMASLERAVPPSRDAGTGRGSPA